MKQMPINITSCKTCPYREAHRLDTRDVYHICRLFNINVFTNDSISPDCKLEDVN